MTQKPSVAVVGFTAAVISMSGCSQSDTTATSENTDDPVEISEMPPVIGGHAHPEHGPHGGHLIELGQEDYHGELVHSQQELSIYVLDGSATEQVPIPSEKLVLSMKLGEEVELFDLASNPDTTDPDGQTSRFTSTDVTLLDWIDKEAEGALVIEIDGKSFTGKVTHHEH